MQNSNKGETMEAFRISVQGKTAMGYERYVTLLLRAAKMETALRLARKEIKGFERPNSWTITKVKLLGTLDN